MKNDDDFLKELLSMFKVEAEEHLKTISSGLVDLEKTTGKDRIKILEGLRKMNITDYRTFGKFIRMYYVEPEKLVETVKRVVEK